MPARPQMAPTEDWRQIALLARAPGQRPSEVMRPVVRFGQSAAARAAETGAAERTLDRQAARFDQLGMASLVPPPKVAKHRVLPAEVRPTILDAKRAHPPRDGHERTTICGARCGHRPSSHTVKRILAESPPPPRTHRRFPPYHAIAAPRQRRLAIVRRHVEGWNATSIAAHLETSRQTVPATLKRGVEEEGAGLPDKSRAPHRPATDAQRASLQHLGAQDPPIATAVDVAAAFLIMLRRREGERLPAWLEAAEASGISKLERFARTLRADHNAVQAGLTLRHSNGQTEGQVNRLKLIKRQGYGRANFDLLRQRVLRAA